jgi:hypothetical protein
MTIITRKQYLNNEVTPQQYYGQPAFQTPEVKAAVLNAIGLDNILNSTDEYFNDIPINLWDRLNIPIIRLVGAAIKEANQPGPGEATGISLSDTLCIAKQAAQIIKEEHQ